VLYHIALQVITSKDYSLLLGMPGTGKTSTVSFIVRLLLARGATVLVTSYTHSAVDTLLLKLLSEGVPCLRIGASHAVHPGVRHCCVDAAAAAAAAAAAPASTATAVAGAAAPQGVSTTAQYAALVESARVVGVTCLGVGHPLFMRKRFDYSVVDEAGQITQAATLGPLRCADAFVLVGDHYQLPPLVASQVSFNFTCS
jgi:DNA replication ATP-dependent helicase Dna2